MSTLISTVNLARAHGTLVASSELAEAPVSNLLRPSIYLPWRTTGTGQSWAVIDLGAPRNVDRIALLGANFASVQIQQHATDAWGAPTYDSGVLTIAADPDLAHYRRWADKGGAPPYTLRFTRILIPAQATLDGAPFFSLGALWMGTFTALPLGLMLQHERAVVTPAAAAAASLGEWGVSYVSGDGFLRSRQTRRVSMGLTPGVGDEWGSWLALDRAIQAAGGLFCVCSTSWGTPAAASGVWIVRQTNRTRWQLEWPRAEDEWSLEEVVAGP